MRKIFTLLSLPLVTFFFPLHAESLPSYKLGYQYLQDKSSLPKRNSRIQEKLLLNNGLRVYLIHDPSLKESIFSFSVGSGMLDDGLEFPGLSHLVEKALFTSSKRYPEGIEALFKQRHIQLWSQTFLDRTVYTFSSVNDQLATLIDQCAAAIKAPNFSHSIIEDTLAKLDKDYQVFSKEPLWPLELVKQKLARPSHPYASYFPGSSQSLEGLQPRHVQKWFKSHYSPRNMRLVLISPLKIDKVREDVLKSFYGFDRKSMLSSESAGKIFSHKSEGKKISIYQSYLPHPQAVLSWEIDARYLNEAAGYQKILQQLFAADTEGSLASLLKKEGLISSMEVNLVKIGRENLTLDFSFNLSDKELYDKVVARCFQAIESFKRSQLPEYLPKEISQLEHLNAQWPKRQDPRQEGFEMAMRLLDEDMSTFPDKSSYETASFYDSMSFLGFLKELTASRARLFSLQPSNQLDRPSANMEPHTQSRYFIQDIPPKDLIQYNKAIPLANVSPPKPNPYISLDQKLISEVQVFDNETLAIDSDEAKIYHVALEELLSPRIFWELRVKTPAVNHGSVKDQVFLDLISLSLKRQTQQLKHFAKRGGIDFDFSPFPEGLLLRIEGFSEKAPLLLQELSYELRSLHLSPKHFEKDKSLLFNQYRGLSDLTPLKQGENILSSLIYKDFVTEKEKAKHISSLTYMDYQKFVRTMWKKTFIEGVMLGNTTVEQARNTANDFIKQLSQKPFLSKEQNPPEILVLNPQRGPFSITEMLSHQDQGLMLLMDHGNYEASKFIHLKVLHNLMNQELKTTFSKSSIHLANVMLKNIAGQLFTLFSFEASGQSSKHLLDNCESFLSAFLQKLPSSLNETSFAEQKKEVEKQLSPSFASLYEKGRFISSLLYEARKDFSYLEHEKQALHFLHRTKLLEEAQRFLGKGNKKRLALLLEGMLPKESAAYYKLLEDKKQILLFNRFTKGKKQA